jgi:hypothetical protein
MNIEVEIDTDPIMETLQKMHNTIAHLKRVDIGAELSAWQTQDMHRHRPFTMRNRGQGTAKTKIRPHSLYEMVRSEGATLPVKEQRHLVRGLRRKLGHPLSRRFYKTLRVHRHWSQRPILRQVLEDQLWERFKTMVEEKLIWE